MTGWYRKGFTLYWTWKSRRIVHLNLTEGPSSVRWVTFAIIAAHVLRADNDGKS